MKVVLIHGWLSGPNHHWFYWLKRELRKRGFEVIAPVMPNPVRPNKEQWVAQLKKIISQVDPADTILIGHSLGVPTILYALQDFKGAKFAQVILVSGFARKIPHMEEFIDGYTMEDLNLKNVKTKAASWVCIHGDNDPLVPFEQGEWLAKQLGAELMLENGRGHLTQFRGVVKLPSALKAILHEQNPLCRDVINRVSTTSVKKSKAPIHLQSALDAILKIRDKTKNLIKR